MANEKIQINAAEGSSEIVIRNGNALPVLPNKAVKIEGTIDAPLRYLKNRKGLINLDLPGTRLDGNCFLTVSLEDGSICLVVNEHSPEPDIVRGEIEISKHIKNFDFDSGTYRTPEDTAVFLRKRKHLFASEEEYIKVFTALRTFIARINQDVAAIKDDAGNYEQKRKQAVEHNIPKDFALYVPIFKGTAPISVTVEFLVDKALNVAMISTDLIQKTDQMREEIIEKVVKGIEEEVPELLVVYI